MGRTGGLQESEAVVGMLLYERKKIKINKNPGNDLPETEIPKGRISLYYHPKSQRVYLRYPAETVTTQETKGSCLRMHGQISYNNDFSSQ